MTTPIQKELCLNADTLSSHPCVQWSDAQQAAAKAYGKIIDMPIPTVDAEAGEQQVAALATQYAEKLTDMNPHAVLCQGEMTLTFALVCLLQRHGIPVLAATSERITKEQPLPHGTVEKISYFRFCHFRR